MKKSLLKKTVCCIGLSVFLLLVLTHSSPGVEVKYTSHNLRNPFKSPFEAEEEDVKVRPQNVGALPEFSIQGLIWDSPLPQAVINNKVVGIGSFIEGAEIIDIKEKGIYILYQGQEHILKSSISKK